MAKNIQNQKDVMNHTNSMQGLKRKQTPKQKQ